MYHLMFWSCWFAALCINKNTVVKIKTEFVDVYKTKTVEKIIKDPRGLVKQDIEEVSKVVAEVHYKAGDTLDTIAYRQGQADLLRFLRRKFLGG